MSIKASEITNTTVVIHRAAVPVRPGQGQGHVHHQGQEPMPPQPPDCGSVSPRLAHSRDFLACVIMVQSVR